MARKLSTISFKDSAEHESTLDITYHYRGQLSGKTRFGLTYPDGTHASFLLNSPEDALELAEYLKREVCYDRSALHSQPTFETIGFALKVMCDGNVIKAFYDQSQFKNGIDSFNYISLTKAFPEYASPDYYFVLYGIKDGLDNETLETITETCVNYQKAVIVSGDLRVCRPMTQLMIADIVGFDNTTVSRAVKDVRVFTAHRNYSLDRNTTSMDFPSLFDEGIEIKGQKISTMGIKVKIRAIIENEDKAEPYTDGAIAKLLVEYGYPIARKTVQKYREEILGIPNSNKRRVR